MSNKNKSLNVKIKTKINDIYNIKNMKLAMIISIAFIIIFTVLILAINIGALLWINKLEKISCKCSEHWKRTYIKRYIYFILALQLINLISTIIYRVKFSDIIKNNLGINIYILFSIGILIATILNIIYTITYIDDLRKENCSCSEDIKRELYYYYTMIYGIFMFVLFIILCISILFGILFSITKISK